MLPYHVCPCLWHKACLRKRWGCVYICFASRGVDTASFRSLKFPLEIVVALPTQCLAATSSFSTRCSSIDAQRSFYFYLSQKFNFVNCGGRLASLCAWYSCNDAIIRVLQSLAEFSSCAVHVYLHIGGMGLKFASLRWKLMDGNCWVSNVVRPMLSCSLTCVNRC